MPADVPRRVTRAQADRLRREFYLATGMARDDVALPKLVPPGAALVVNADPAKDFAVSAENEVEADMLVANATRQARTPMPSQGGAQVNAIDVFALSAQHVLASDPTYRDDWWYATPWGQERVVWTPPRVLGIFGYEPTVAFSLPRGSVVLVDATPGSFGATEISITGIPASQETFAFSNMAGGIGKNWTSRQLALVQSDALLMSSGDRMHPQLQEVVRHDGSRVVAFTGAYNDVESSSNFVHQVVETVARSVALEVVIVAVSAVVSFGALAGVFEGVLAGGASAVAGAGSVVGGGFLDAGEALLAAAAANGGVTGLAEVTLAIAANAAGLAVASAGAVAGLGLGVAAEVGAAAITNPSVVGAVASVAAPDQVNALLVEIAKGTVYASLVPIVGPLIDLTIEDLTTLAQTSAAKRDEVAADLAMNRQKVEAEPWFKAVQAASQVVGAIVNNVVGAIFPVLLLVEAAVSAATMGLRLEQAREVVTAMKTHLDATLQTELDAILAEDAHVQAEINALMARSDPETRARLYASLQSRLGRDARLMTRMTDFEVSAKNRADASLNSAVAATGVAVLETAASLIDPLLGSIVRVGALAAKGDWAHAGAMLAEVAVASLVPGVGHALASLGQSIVLAADLQDAVRRSNLAADRRQAAEERLQASASRAASAALGGRPSDMHAAADDLCATIAAIQAPATPGWITPGWISCSPKPAATTAASGRSGMIAAAAVALASVLLLRR